MNNCDLNDSELQSLVNVLQNTTNNITGLQLIGNRLSNRCFKTVRDFIGMNKNIIWVDLTDNTDINNNMFKKTDKIIVNF